MELSTFKSPSKILFEVGTVTVEKRPTVKEAKRGDVFALCGDRVDNPVCMLVDVSVHKLFEKHSFGTNISEIIRCGYMVVNLQTGRVFSVPPDTEVEWLRVKMIVDGSEDF